MQLTAPLPMIDPVPADLGPPEAAHFLSLLVRDYGHIQHLLESGAYRLKLDLGPTRVLSCFIGTPKHPYILLTTLLSDFCSLPIHLLLK